MTDDRFSGIGVVVTGAELRFTPQGTAIATMRIKSGEEFYGVDIWEPATWFENSSDDWPEEQFPKGALVAVEGSVRVRTYQKADGSEASSRDITAWAAAPMWRKPKREG